MLSSPSTTFWNTSDYVEMTQGTDTLSRPYDLRVDRLRSDKIKLVWKDSSNHEDGFVVEYRNVTTDSDWLVVDGSEDLEENDEQLEFKPSVLDASSGDTVKFRVYARNDAGLRSADSNIKTVNLPDLLLAPYNLRRSVAPVDDEIGVQWSYDGPVGDEFVVQVSTDSGFRTIVYESTTTNQFDDYIRPLEADTLYYIRVATKGEDGSLSAYAQMTQRTTP